MMRVGSVMGASRPRRSGLTMVEAVVSITIVGVMMVAALNTVAASQLGQKKTGDRGRGTLLAAELMTEILNQAYEDSAFAAGSFGRSGAEVATGNRSLYDDVDDYDQWSAGPPQYKDGTVIANLTGWLRSVDVAWVSAANLKTPSGTDQRVKRIVVTVSRDNVPVASVTAIRTASGPVDRLP